MSADAETRIDAGFGSTDLMLLLMTLIWGSNFAVIKYSLEDFLPFSFNGLRFAMASVAMLMAILLTGNNLKVSSGDGWRLFGLGLLANTVYQSLFIIGMNSTRTGNAALIVSTTPLFTAVISRIRKQEYFTASGIAGLVLAFAGIVLIILSSHDEIEIGKTVLGDCLLLGATLSWALYTVGTKRFMHKYGAMKATALMMITGTPILLLISAPSFLRQDWPAIRPLAWGGLTFSALLAIALAYIIWNHSVRKIGSTRTAIYSNIVPVVAMLVAWVALGEMPTFGQFAGAIIIFTGLYLVRRGMIPIASTRETAEQMEESSLGPGKN